MYAIMVTVLSPRAEVFYDVMYCIKNYGIVPQEVMPGIMYGDTLPVHNELDAVASGYIKLLRKVS